MVWETCLSPMNLKIQCIAQLTLVATLKLIITLLVACLFRTHYIDPYSHLVYRVCIHPQLKRCSLYTNTHITHGHEIISLWFIGIIRTIDEYVYFIEIIQQTG